MVHGLDDLCNFTWERRGVRWGFAQDAILSHLYKELNFRKIKKMEGENVNINENNH